MSMQQLQQQPAHDGTALDDFRKLVRCNVASRHGEIRVRFVELECFSLWEHMMRTRHGAECKDYSISLWIPATEFERQSRLYEHCGNVEAVLRFNFHLFDETNRYTYSASRYVPEDDVGRFKEVIFSHIPPDILQSESFSYEAIPGYCIARENVTNRDDLLLGIFKKLHGFY